MEQKSSILEIGMVYTLHEMKNPLTSMILCLEMLQAGEIEEADAMYSILKKNAIEMRKAITDLCECFDDKALEMKFVPDKSLQKKLNRITAGKKTGKKMNDGHALYGEIFPGKR